MRWTSCECFALKREQAPSPQKQFCVKSGVAVQFFEEHGHFFFSLFVTVGAGGFQALFPGLAGCGGVALALVGFFVSASHSSGSKPPRHKSSFV